MNRALAIVISLLVVFIATFYFGHSVGANGERAAWQAERVEMLDARAKAVAALVNKYDVERRAAEAKARAATAAHDKALSDLDHHYETDLAAVRRAGGLRIPAPASCRPAAAAGEATGASGPDEAGAGTVELPERTQERLFGLTLRADQLAEQLRALQGWVRANGFYGSPDENTGNP